ncbi:MAG TPA: CHAT domain-containing protein [Saprospiraceae bacterium]|nr:CHAT domain-containing protein [Saprospiraceae bacterium]HMP25036.1 CHAT domain-containing protein [Saprospiraceae bacterium]
MKLSYLVFISFLLFIPFSSYGQEDPSALEAYLNHIVDEVLPACDKKKDIDCINREIEIALAKMENSKAWINYADLMSWKLYYNGQYNRNDNMLRDLKIAENIIETHKQAFGEQYRIYLDDIQARTGTYYYKTGDYSTSLRKFKALETNLESLPDKNHTNLSDLSFTYWHLGLILKHLGDYEIARDYFNKGILTQKKRGQDERSSGDIAILYKHIGDIAFLKKDYKEALINYERAEQIYVKTDTSKSRNRNGLVETLTVQANLYKVTQDYEKALKKIQSANTIDNSIAGIDFDTYYRFGEVYAAMSDLSKAFHYFNQALARRNEVFGYKHYKVAEVYQALGELHARQGDWACALEHYQEALVSLNENFDSYDITKSPQVYERSFVRKELVGILAYKTEALRQWYAQNGDKKLLETAWQTVLAAVSAIDLLKTSPSSSEEDKLFLVEESFPVYENALAIAADLGADYYAHAFDIMEKSKGIILLEAFKNANALALAGIPDTLLEKESQIKYEIANLEDALFKSKTPDTDQSYQRDRLFDLKKEYRALIALFESQYPTYHQLKYDTKTLTVGALQNQLLGRDEALVEYFVGDKDLYIFTITKKNIKLYRSKLNFPLVQQVADLRHGIYNYHLSPQPTDSLYQATSALYAENAHQLYTAVFAPIAKNLPQRVIIIPDGVLGYVPFEVLLPQKILSNTTQFSNHDYLLKHYEFSYCYSATLLQEMQQRKVKKNGLLAFAPNFQDRPNTHTQSIALLRSNLDTLYYNQSEVAAIKRIFGKGETYVGNTASKQTFLKRAPDFGIIHIATHGVLNDTASNYSFVAFTANNKQRDSNQLYVKDLYNLKLQAALVVLSACETGLGELKRGEGIISLSRGFAYAGTQSIVSTFWAVNDLSTTQIMRSFYENLKATHTKSAALREAKLSYLAQRKDNLAAHPFFWAAYIPIGDMRPITNNLIFYYILIGGVIIGVFGLIWKYQRSLAIRVALQKISK